jgi:HD-like signal output (HDOD) protein
MAQYDGEDVNALLDQISQVCPVPAAAQRVIVLTGSGDVDLGDVAEAIAADPALAAEALRIANSAVYRRTRSVDSLSQAVLMLGLEQIHSMAVAMALLASFRTQCEMSLRFHESSVISGSIAGLLASEVVDVSQAAAFVAGLLCEVGAMACVVVDGDRFGRLFEHAEGSWERRARLEAETYGLSSWQIGQRLLERNDLPGNITSAVGAHYDVPAENLDNLSRLTIFSRMASPAVSTWTGDEVNEEDSQHIVEIAAVCLLTEISQQRLVGLCRRAVATAERTMRTS